MAPCPIEEHIEWMRNHLEGVDHGEIGIVAHIREGRICWVEHLNRTTHKHEKNIDIDEEPG